MVYRNRANGTIVPYVFANICRSCSHSAPDVSTRVTHRLPPVYVSLLAGRLGTHGCEQGTKEEKRHNLIAHEVTDHSQQTAAQSGMGSTDHFCITRARLIKDNLSNPARPRPLTPATEYGRNQT
jgi:hypothetical protein